VSNLVRIQAIKDELSIDPLTRGYAGMDDQQAADSLNTVDRTVDREFMTASEIFESIEVAEYKALAAGEKSAVDKVLGLGDNIRIAPGTKARAFLLDAFTAGSTTRSNLATIAQESVSRSVEIGVGPVHIGDVQHARIL